MVSIVAVTAMMLAYPLAKSINLLLWKWKKKWHQDAIEDDDFERILNDAASRNLPIAVTMSNKKVYVGFVLRTFDPNQSRKSIAVLPLMSGYRSDVDGRLNFTTYYVEIYGDDGLDAPDSQLPDPLKHLSPRDFEIALPIDKVQSLGLFDLKAYAEFSKRQTTAPKGGIAEHAHQADNLDTDGLSG